MVIAIWQYRENGDIILGLIDEEKHWRDFPSSLYQPATRLRENWTANDRSGI